MDLVNAQQTLTEEGGGALLKELHLRNASGAAEEEEVDVKICVPSTQGKGVHGDETPVRRQLLSAVRQDDAPGVLQFVADGAEVPIMAEALRLAAHRGSAAVVRELVAVGLSVNDFCPQTGFTPLQLAAVAGHVVVCELLLDALADVHRPVGGSTALALARKMGNVEVEEVIERHVAALMLSDQGENDESAACRRAHVLPRVSPVLSEAVLQALPPPAPMDRDTIHVAQVRSTEQPALVLGDLGETRAQLVDSPMPNRNPSLDPEQVLPL